MSKLLKRVCALTMAFALIASCSLFMSYAENDNNKASNTVNEQKTDNNNGEAVLPTANAETVYVIADSNGSVQKVLVSSWLKNSSGADKIKESSNVSDVINSKSDETYTMDSNGMRIWNANGNDIYSQGTSDNSLPIDVSIKYYLNGNDISTDDLKGKSGHVKVLFEYKNNESRKVDIDGESYTMYIPFVALSGALLNNDTFTNVSVTNGKLINDGDKTAVIGYALPGLSESLGISDEKFDIPSSFEIEADVTDFSFETTLTLVTNEVFNQIDVEDVSDYNSLIDNISKLTEASSKLRSGSSELYNGVSKLLDKSDELIEGINQLKKGAEALKKGAGSLSDGATELAKGTDKLNAGMGELYSGTTDIKKGSGELYIGLAKADAGMQQLVENNDNLTSGAETVFNTLLKTAKDQLEANGITVPNLTIDNYKVVLEKVVASLDAEKVRALAYNTALQTVKEQIEQNRQVIYEQVLQAYRENITAEVLKKLGMDMSYEEYSNAVEAGAIPQDTNSMIIETVEAQLKQYIDNGTIDAVVNQKIEELIEQTMQSEEVKKQIQEAVEKAAAGKVTIESLIKQLDSYNEFYSGLCQYTAGVSNVADGVGQIKNGAGKLSSGADALVEGATELYSGTDELNNGANELSSGANKLYDGSAELYNGISKLVEGSGKLTSGVSALRDGSKELRDGMKKFDEDGINKLSEAVGDVDTLIKKLRELQKLSKSYKSFTGNNDIEDSSVKFIYKTSAID